VFDPFHSFAEICGRDRDLRPSPRYFAGSGSGVLTGGEATYWLAMVELAYSPGPWPQRCCVPASKKRSPSPPLWHLRAAGGADHSITTGPSSSRGEGEQATPFAGKHTVGPMNASHEEGCFFAQIFLKVAANAIPSQTCMSGSRHTFDS
jgi:hypothetical protein